MSKRKKGPADFQSDPVEPEQERADWDNMDFRQTIAHHHRKLWTKYAKAHTDVQYPDFEHLDDDQILSLVEQAQMAECEKIYGKDRGPHAPADVKPGVCFCASCFAVHLRRIKTGASRG